MRRQTRKISRSDLSESRSSGPSGTMNRAPFSGHLLCALIQLPSKLAYFSSVTSLQIVHLWPISSRERIVAIAGQERVDAPQASLAFGCRLVHPISQLGAITATATLCNLTNVIAIRKAIIRHRSHFIVRILI